MQPLYVVSIKRNVWYRFTNHRWKLIEEGHSLREMISTEVTTGLRGLLGQLTNDITADTAANIALKETENRCYL